MISGSGAWEWKARDLTYNSVVRIKLVVVIQEDVLVMGGCIGNMKRASPGPLPSAAGEAHIDDVRGWDVCRVESACGK